MFKQFFRATLLGLTGLTAGLLLMLACTDDEDDAAQPTCAFTCTSAADCGVDGATCASGFCHYDNAVLPDQCDPANTDPNDPLSCYGAPDDCRPFHSYQLCVTPCTVDTDCEDETYECAGIDDDGNRFCSYVFSCTPGEACPGGLGVCNTAGDGCTCSSDADCTTEGTACYVI